VEVCKGSSTAAELRYGASAVIPASFGRYSLAARVESLLVKVYDPA